MRVAAIFVLAIAFAGALAVYPREATHAQPATITVDTTDDTVANDGACSLREAVDNANDGATTHADCAGGSAENEIVLPQGTFVLTGGELVITAPVHIVGQGDTDSGTVLSGNDASRIFLVEADVAVHLMDVNLRQGAAAHGAAIYQEFGDLVLSSVRIQENHATSEGGGIYMAFTANSLELDDVWVRVNSATVAGGGIAAYGPVVSIVDSAINENSTDGDGGGLRLAMTAATIVDSEMRNNSAGGDGGGIWADDAIPPVDLAFVSSGMFNNEAGGFGGAMYFQSGELLIEDALLGLNDAVDGGAGIWIWTLAGGTAELTVINSHFSTHVTAGQGGAIAFHGTAGTGLLHVEGSSFGNNNSFVYGSMGLYGVTGTVVNTTFASTAGINVRVSDPGSDVTFTNTTFIGDYSGVVTADVLLLAIHDANVTVNNSVFVAAREEACVEENEGSIQGTGNADDDGTCPGAIAITADDLAPYVNVTEITNGHFPTPGSALIDAGNAAFCPEVDQRGWPRSEDCDIGALEFVYRFVIPLAARDVD